MTNVKVRQFPVMEPSRKGIIYTMKKNILLLLALLVGQMCCLFVPRNCFAQSNILPEGASVSALGRTAKVRADGSFAISSVPANLGNFKIRLVGTDGLQAVSACLIPVANSITIVPALDFVTVTPIPSVLTLSAPTTMLGTVGQTAQLTVTGKSLGFPNFDLTADGCTTYLISNPRIATVDTTGKVTLIRKPFKTIPLTITAMNEGATGTFTFQILPDTTVRSIRVAAIGANDGTRAADMIFSSGDLPGSVTRLSTAQFNALTGAQLRASYDVLIVTWNTPNNLNIDWTTGIKPFLDFGGGVIWEDPVNIGKLKPAINGQALDSGGPYTIMPVAGITDGVTSSFVNRHTRYLSWDPHFAPFIMSGADVVGLYGQFENGGRMILTGPDNDYHAVRAAGGAAGNQYNMLVNEIQWVAPGTR